MILSGRLDETAYRMLTRVSCFDLPVTGLRLCQCLTPLEKHTRVFRAQIARILSLLKRNALVVGFLYDSCIWRASMNFLPQKWYVLSHYSGPSSFTSLGFWTTSHLSCRCEKWGKTISVTFSYTESKENLQDAVLSVTLFSEKS